ncbi:MAG: VCBS repeat-containing protein [Saprospiraceae bacterium]|nr:VCBS repeat-containing protein [Saprospiraceae bacterium]
MMKQTKLTIVVYLCIIICACTPEPDHIHVNSSEPLFESIHKSHSNLAFFNRVEESSEINFYKYVYLYNGGGVGIADINNDGLKDVYFTSTMGKDKLYLNQGNFEFKDISRSAGIDQYGSHKTGVNFIDINNDGWMDIYVCRSGWTTDLNDLSNLLFINNKDNTFTESATEYGLNTSSYSVQSIFFDYDKDGDNDMFLLNHPQKFKQPLPEMIDRINKPVLADSDRLYENIGGNKFKDVTEASGILNYGYGLGVAATDFNNDGWIDLFISNDFAPHDYYYINNGDGTFTESIKEYFNHCSYFSMGSDIVDINNDNWMDLFVVEMLSEDNVRQKTNMAPMDMDRFDYMVDNDLYYQYMRNAFHLNHGNGHFGDIAYYAGIDKTDWSWGTLFGDYDNDGDNDLLVANGYLKDTQDKDFNKKSNDLAKRFNNQLTFDQVHNLLKSTPLANYAFKNDGEMKFENVSSDWGFDFSGYSNGMAYGDLDNDGDLDVIVNNINSYASLYKNTSDNAKFVKFKLEGPPLNVNGLNSRIQLHYSNGGSQNQSFQVSRGFQSSCEPIIHFGLGSNLISHVTVLWSDGKYESFDNIKVGQLNTLKYGSAPIAKAMDEPSPIMQELQASSSFDFIHKEIEFDDYDLQVLLPHKLSQMGPALAKADINGDGLEDVYIGGAHGQSAQLFTQTPNGRFLKQVVPDFESDANFEDTDAAFIDIDKDGDLDLYVASGSNEFFASPEWQQDRIYQNDNGGFKKIDVLPALHFPTGAIAFCDIDKDGDIDIFVGTRHIPAMYPHPAQSYLLINNGGAFEIDVSISPEEFNELGLITAAEWMDYDADGDMDLIVVGEWTDILWFENDNGKLNKTKVLDADNVGWWNSIEISDIDGDGLEDIVLGNLGDNYKYQATDDKPFEVFADDFDNNGTQDIVVCYYNGDELFPVRGLQCSSEQIPDIKKTFTSYEAFGKADLFDVYGEALTEALHYSANNFKSIVLWNEGHGKFNQAELPYQAQLFPVQDIICTDLNGDKLTDLILSGNWFVSEIETPRADNGSGLVLLNKGSRQWNALDTKASGLFTPHDVRSLLLVESPNTKKLIVGNNNYAAQVFEFD